MSSSDDQSSRSFLAHFVILALGNSTSDDSASDNEIEYTKKPRKNYLNILLAKAVLAACSN
jgi:hypothetical protein